MSTILFFLYIEGTFSTLKYDIIIKNDQIDGKDVITYFRLSRQLKQLKLLQKGQHFHLL